MSFFFFFFCLTKGMKSRVLPFCPSQTYCCPVSKLIKFVHKSNAVKQIFLFCFVWFFLSLLYILSLQIGSNYRRNTSFVSKDPRITQYWSYLFYCDLIDLEGILFDWVLPSSPVSLITFWNIYVSRCIRGTLFL